MDARRGWPGWPSRADRRKGGAKEGRKSKTKVTDGGGRFWRDEGVRIVLKRRRREENTTEGEFTTQPMNTNLNNVFSIEATPLFSSRPGEQWLHPDFRTVRMSRSRASHGRRWGLSEMGERFTWMVWG